LDASQTNVDVGVFPSTYDSSEAGGEAATDSPRTRLPPARILPAQTPRRTRSLTVPMWDRKMRPPPTATAPSSTRVLL